jgi:hypothetical protein
MLTVKVEQRVNVKLLGKSATQMYNLSVEAYCDECLSRTQVFEWFTRFKEGRGEIKDNPCPGQPCTSKTDANIDKESIRQILHENFNVKKMCSKMVPRILTPERKETRTFVLPSFKILKMIQTF